MHTTKYLYQCKYKIYKEIREYISELEQGQTEKPNFLNTHPLCWKVVKKIMF